MDHPLLGFLILFIAWINLDSVSEATSRNQSTDSVIANKSEEIQTDINGERWARGYYLEGDAPPSRDRNTWRGKVMNKLRRRTSSLLGTKPTQEMNYGGHSDNYSDEEVEDSDMAGAFWNLYSAGGGYSGGGGGYGKYVNKSAVGLLGFLSLLSLIQNGLTTTAAAATTAPPGRRKRESNDHDFEPDEAQTNLGDQQDQITRIVLPMLISVAAVRDKGTPLKCVLRKVCQTNKILVREFHDHGRSVGTILNNGLANILRRVGIKEIAKLRYAGKAGRNAKDCNQLYETCQKL